MRSSEGTEPPVLIERRGRVGHLTLNRPRAINALTGEMVGMLRHALELWRNNDGVATVLLTGAGDRGLCAGGDIVSIYHDALASGTASEAFWRDEYALNAEIARYPKPIVALQDGIVLGGGIGVSAHAGIRIVTETSRLGMPETAIGFVPDVGGTWLLARAPGESGTHAALTAAPVGAADALFLGLADHFVERAHLPALVEALETEDAALVVARFGSTPPPGELADARWIDTAYAGASEATFSPFPGFGSLKPSIDAVKPLADKHGIGVFDRARGDQLMTVAGYKKNAGGIWEKDGQPLAAIIEAIPVLNAIGPVVAQQLKNSGIDASFRSTPESRAIMRDGKYDLTLFGHRGSISDPYASLEMYHSRNAFEVGRPTLFPARWSNADYDKIVDEIGKLAPDNPKIGELVVAAMDIWMREAVEAPISEWYHRVPMNQTYWTGWPTEQNPYMQPSFWYTSGSFGYVLPRLKPAN
jgi:enoyl-CoA hydratase/carnithine racemase